MQCTVVIICLFSGAWGVSGIDVKALFINVPTGVTCTGSRSGVGGGLGSIIVTFGFVVSIKKSTSDLNFRPMVWLHCLEITPNQVAFSLFLGIHIYIKTTCVNMTTLCFQHWHLFRKNVWREALYVINPGSICNACLLPCQIYNKQNGQNVFNIILLQGTQRSFIHVY